MRQFNLEEYLKNPSRKIVTRDGRNATIHCTNFRGIFPIIAEIESVGKSFSYNEDGKTSYVGSSVYDLFFAPEKHEGWVNIYHGKDGPLTGNVIFASKEEAEESSRHCCGFTKDLYMTSAKIEWEE